MRILHIEQGASDDIVAVVLVVVDNLQIDDGTVQALISQLEDKRLIEDGVCGAATDMCLLLDNLFPILLAEIELDVWIRSSLSVLAQSTGFEDNDGQVVESGLIGQREEYLSTSSDAVRSTWLERKLYTGLRVQKQLSLSQTIDTLSDDGVSTIAVEGDYLKMDSAHGDLFIGHSVHGEDFVVLWMSSGANDAGLDSMIPLWQQLEFDVGIEKTLSISADN
jgi:hypothetical protein